MTDDTIVPFRSKAWKSGSTDPTPEIAAKAPRKTRGRVRIQGPAEFAKVKIEVKHNDVREAINRIATWLEHIDHHVRPELTDDQATAMAHHLAVVEGALGSVVFLAGPPPSPTKGRAA